MRHRAYFLELAMRAANVSLRLRVRIGDTRFLDDAENDKRTSYTRGIDCQNRQCFVFRYQALARDSGAHASRGQRGQRVPFDCGLHRGGALQVGISGVSERNYAFPHRDRGLFREGCSLRTAHQSFAAALRQNRSHQYVLFDSRKI